MSLKKLETWKKTTVKKLKKINWKKVLPIALVVYVLLMCTLVAMKVRFDCAPDEAMKYNVVHYVSEHMSLPRGDDPEVMDYTWGASYAFKPYVSYIMSGVITHFVSMFTESFRWIIFSARWVNVAFLVGYAIMILFISKKLFKGLWRAFFVVLTTLIPQVLYLGGYLNNDAIALFAISVIFYAWLLGLESKWSLKSCIILGVGVGICALSYYNAFGYILCSVILFVASSIADKEKFTRFLKKGLIISAIAFALAGWFYIRNAIIYNGDAFDLHASKDTAEIYAAEDHKPTKHSTVQKNGMTIREMLNEKDWVKLTVQSFFGYFGYWQSSMRYQDFLAYEGIFSIGIFGAFASLIYLMYYLIKKRKRNAKDKLQIAPATNFAMSNKKRVIFYLVSFLAAVIPVALSLYYSYTSDYQPQGRYIMPMLIPLGYFIVCGYRFMFGGLSDVKRNILLGILICFFVAMPVFVFFNFVFPKLPW